jgi:small subunit ribosomal protein S20
MPKLNDVGFGNWSYLVYNGSVGSAGWVRVQFYMNPISFEKD